MVVLLEVHQTLLLARKCLPHASSSLQVVTTAWGAGLGGAAGASLQRERAAGEEAHTVQVCQRAHGALDLGLTSAALRCKVELPLAFWHETSSNDVVNLEDRKSLLSGVNSENDVGQTGQTPSSLTCKLWPGLKIQCIEGVDVQETTRCESLTAKALADQVHLRHVHHLVPVRRRGLREHHHGGHGVRAQRGPQRPHLA